MNEEPQEQKKKRIEVTSALLQSILDHSLDAILLTAPDGRILQANPAACRMFQRSRDELCRLGRQAVVDASDPRLAEALARRAESGHVHCQVTLLRADGTRFPAEITSSLFAAADGQSVTSMIIRDISERVRAEEALRKSEARYRAVVEDQTEVICRFGPEGTFTFVNDVACQFFGRSRWDLLRTRWQTMPVLEDLPAIERQLGAITPANPIVTIENRVVDGDGRIRWMQFVNRGFYDGQGCLSEIQTVGRDVTPLKEMQVSLAASRDELRALVARLQEVREEEHTRMAREIHDVLGQELSLLKMSLLWLNTQLAQPLDPRNLDRLREEVQAMIRGADRAIESVRQTATNLRPAILDRVGLAAAIAWLAEDFQRRTGILCRVPLPSEPASVGREGATCLFRIVQESLTNVLRHAAATQVEISLTSAHEQVVLSIQDDGRGIPADKFHDPRSGGLNGMRERALSLGGRCKISSHPGRGTRIEVCLPLLPRTPNEGIV